MSAASERVSSPVGGVVCPVCEKLVRPRGLHTGLTELLAARIHLEREHGVVRATDEMADLRYANEREDVGGLEVVEVDVDAALDGPEAEAHFLASKNFCGFCEEPLDGPGGPPKLHRACGIRMAVGSVGHQLGRCPCPGAVPGGDEGDPAGVTRRQAAQAAELFERTRRTLHIVDFPVPPAPTFELPADEERKALRPGDFAKVVFRPPSDQGREESRGAQGPQARASSFGGSRASSLGGERIWVKVESATPDGFYTGRLDNDPIVVDAKCGDVVAFVWSSVINIMRKEER